ncbi:MAG: NAD(P)-binding domain-containing protein [Ectothiorhodospiraceae bacterium]|nr:NAD(P)-binding domain-containing protein [Ectothiorhodospiraceae bacterium]
MEKQPELFADIFYLLSVIGIDDAYKVLTFLIPIALAWFIYKKVKNRRDQHSTNILHESKEAGLADAPISLHPIIDHNLCLGCATCVDACPEGKILGVIREKAHLVNPSHCIGHGACKTSCPTDAISLVIGNEKRGVDIPMLNPNFETNVPGLFVAGELGGMGLIRNAIEQGRQAMESVRETVSNSQADVPYDVVIIGAGPSGFSATLGAHEHNLKYVTLEQETLGGTVAHFPRGKIVMTAPVQLPIVGQVQFNETTKEILMDFWQGVEKQTGVKLNYMERMESIEKTSDGFMVTTLKDTYHTKSVLLAIGRRGTPRKLGVPGEEQSKVIYRLADPAEFQNKHVLIVGGGNSALEAAITIADEPGSTVTLSYRSTAFAKANPKNVDKVSASANGKKMSVLLKSTVKEITEKQVVLNTQDGEITIDNDAIIVCAGGILPTPMLKSLGVTIETKRGTA